MQTQTPNAIRMARHYKRRKAGLAVLSVTVDPIALADALVDALLLNPNQVEDRAALGRACSRMIEIFILEKSR